MECDTILNEKIFVPDDWLRVTRQAKKAAKKYIVYEMNLTSFQKFKEMRNQIFPAKAFFTDKSQVKWQSVKCIQVRKENKRALFIKNEYWELFKELRLQTTFSNRLPRQLYEKSNHISDAKYKD